MSVIRRYYLHLSPGEEKVVQSGAEGVKVKNWVMIRYEKGKTESKKLGVDYYNPMSQIIEFGKNKNNLIPSHKKIGCLYI